MTTLRVTTVRVTTAGDVVLPGLVLTLSRRFDLAREAQSGLTYYACSVIGYCAGLALTLAANTYGITFNDVQARHHRA